MHGLYRARNGPGQERVRPLVASTACAPQSLSANLRSLVTTLENGAVRRCHDGLIRFNAELNPIVMHIDSENVCLEFVSRGHGRFFSRPEQIVLAPRLQK